MNKKIAAFPIIFILTILFLIIFPLPALVIDIIICLYLLFIILFLLVIKNFRNISEFSVFPSLLLLFSVFNLALNISIIRQILTKGIDFNIWIIRNISYVISGTGNIVHLSIGSIIFLVFAAIHIITTYKSSLIVSKAATKFSENNFYGASDGAMKFILGNFKAMIFMFFITCIAGVFINVNNTGADIFSSIQIYVPLAIGSAIVILLPWFIVIKIIFFVFSKVLNPENDVQC